MTSSVLRHHLVERSIDLLLDPRLPHAAPYTLWRRWRYAPKTKHPRLDEPLRICLTFDVEHDYRNPRSIASAARFFSAFMEQAQRNRWHSTLYVQGSLVPRLAPHIREAGDGHEIGLHGLHHEVWGRSRWWQYRLGFVGLAPHEKRKRLQEALDHFDRANLDQPRSFRAPYLNADRATLNLLAEYGFTSDSSPATYLGALPLPRQRAGIWQVPVTANPQPAWSSPVTHYTDLTMGNLAAMPSTELIATIATALHLQQQDRTPFAPHLVFLAHPWEFEHTAGVAHASPANWERLDQVLETISGIYPMTYLTMSDLLKEQATHRREQIVFRARQHSSH